MRYAIVSDLHANLQAWKAVLLDIRSSRVDKIICLGDIIGYGPSPAELLQSVHRDVDHLVLGNHDAAVCGKVDESLFNDTAAGIIRWTRGRLNRTAISFLASLPLTLDAGTFRCAHGDFSEPGAFQYVIDPEDALPSWRTVDNQLLFVGHSHDPCIFITGQSGTPHRIPPQDFVMEQEKRYIVNVGSVGQPRDGEARASYCILDTNADAVYHRRIPFDLDAYRDAMESAGLPLEGSFFLQHDPRSAVPPIRKLLNFSPATTTDKHARDAVAVASIEQLRKRVSRWKIAACGVLLCCTAAFGSAGALWARHANRALVLGAEPTAIRLTETPTDASVLAFPAKSVPPNNPIPGWQLLLGNRRAQTAAVEQAADGSHLFVLASDTDTDDIILSSPSIGVRPGMKISLRGLFRKEPGFTGTIACVLSLVRNTGGEPVHVDQFAVKEPNVPRRGGWLSLRQTIELPAGAESITLHVRGRFLGQVHISELALVRKN